jgi:hypothetical protein
MNVLESLLILVATLSALWWAFARHRAPVALEWLSFAGLGLGVLAVALEGVHARDLAIGPAAEDAVDPAQIH